MFLVLYFCLFGANSGMWYGEQMNLSWSNVKVEEEKLGKHTR
jgi:cell division protein FtsL